MYQTMWVSLTLCVCLVALVAKGKRPNIVFLLVDDQDVMLNSLDAMPKTREIFSENGLQFYNGFASTPVCCVSRSSILLGRYIHNHLVTNNTESGNCYSDEWIATEEEYAYNNYLHKSGYKTYYSGKYLNNYGLGSDNSERTYKTVPAGWDEWYTLCGDAQYYNYKLSNNGQLESHGSDYKTDYFPLLQKQHALKFLSKMEKMNDKKNDNNNEDNDDTPFLMVLASPAAHKPWTPAPEYSYIVNDESMVAPRTLSWNFMENWDKGAVLQSLSEMDDDLKSQSDQVYRLRHATLLTVDDMIADVYNKIASMGELDNTYFIYTADHGFHLGQYGMTFGKKLLYDTDLRVPFYVSGPSVKKNGVTSAMALNVDIAPTIIELALGKDEIPSNMDGRSLVSFFDLTKDEEIELSNKKQMFLVEYYGERPQHDPEASSMKEERPANLWIMNCVSQVDGIDGMNCDTWNNSYSCVRVIDGLKELSSEEDLQLDISLMISKDESKWEKNMNDYLKGEIYCSYTCFDENHMEAECEENTVEYIGEYYDLDYDTWQTVNQMKLLQESVANEYESLLMSLKSCSGNDCREMRLTDSTWYQRESFLINSAENELIDNEFEMTGDMSATTKIIIGVMLLVGLTIVYLLYNHVMSKIIAKEHKYDKVATRANYGTCKSETSLPIQVL